MTTVPTTTARPLPGLEHVAPGIAHQVQAAHDVLVGSLEALLAESRQDADRNAQIAAELRGELYATRAELDAANAVVDEARRLVAAVREARS